MRVVTTETLSVAFFDVLKNNIELDVKTKCIKVRITQVKLAKETIVNNTLVKMMGVP